MLSWFKRKAKVILPEPKKQLEPIKYTMKLSKEIEVGRSYIIFHLKDGSQLKTQIHYGSAIWYKENHTKYTSPCTSFGIVYTGSIPYTEEKPKIVEYTLTPYDAQAEARCQVTNLGQHMLRVNSDLYINRDLVATISVIREPYIITVEHTIEYDEDQKVIINGEVMYEPVANK